MWDLAPAHQPHQPPIRRVSCICPAEWKADRILRSFISQISGYLSGTLSSVVTRVCQQYVRSTNMMTRLIQESKYHSVATESRKRWFCSIPLYSICPVVSFCWWPSTCTYKKLKTCLCFIRGAGGWTVPPPGHVQTDRDLTMSLRLPIQTCSLTVSVSGTGIISQLLCKLLPF